MSRRSKKDRPPARIRGVLADNIRRLRDRKFADLPNETARNKALHALTGISAAQIQRIVLAELGTSVDLIELLAEALDVRPQDLLTPYFSYYPPQMPGGVPEASSSN